MKTRQVGTMALAASLVLSGCASTGPTQEQAGMVIGGILGGIGGNQIGRGSGRTAAIIVGTLAGAAIGAAIGGSIGRSMDETDRLKTAHSLETVRTGVPSAWQNPDTGNSYAVTPTRTYETDEGPCREYTMEARVGNKREQVYGTACRQADGSWKTRS